MPYSQRNRNTPPILVRHAEAESNVTGFIPTAPEGAPLSEDGHNQAFFLGDALVSYFNKTGVRPTKITASPQLRCVQTAQVLADRLALNTLELDDKFVTRGLGAALGQSREYRQQFPTYDDIPGAEPTAAFIRRIQSALHKLEDRETPQLIVTHSGVLRCASFVLSHPFINTTPDTYRTATRSLRTNNASAWKIRADNLENIYPGFYRKDSWS